MNTTATRSHNIIAAIIGVLDDADGRVPGTAHPVVLLGGRVHEEGGVRTYLLGYNALQAHVCDRMGLASHHEFRVVLEALVECGDVDREKVRGQEAMYHV